MSLLRGLAVLAPATVILSACGRPPPATPTKAEATKSLLICWGKAHTEGPDPEDIGAAEESIALRKAIQQRLEGAGYTLASKKCELRVRWHDSWQSRGGDKGYSGATLTLFTPKGEVIDTVQYELDRNHFPLEEPDRLAILFVNSINASAKVGAYAERQRSSHASAPAETTAPAPASAAQ